MTMLKRSRVSSQETPQEEVHRLRAENRMLAQANVEAQAAVAEARAAERAMLDQLEGRIPEATYWLQMKVLRQRRALDARQRKAESRAFVLRTLEKLGRGLTREEYLEARAAEPSERLRERIEDPA
jgi:hypothetical protein